MKIFKKGDRVRVVTKGWFLGLTLHGKIGTVLEDGSYAPWVRFDEPTGYGRASRANHPPWWEEGHMGCPYIGDLELVENEE